MCGTLLYMTPCGFASQRKQERERTIRTNTQYVPGTVLSTLQYIIVINTHKNSVWSICPLFGCLFVHLFGCPLSMHEGIV